MWVDAVLTGSLVVGRHHCYASLVTVGGLCVFYSCQQKICCSVTGVNSHVMDVESHVMGVDGHVLGVDRYVVGVDSL